MTTPDPTHAQRRRERVASLLDEHDVDLLVVTTPSAIAYLTDVDTRGFSSGSKAVVLSDEGRFALVVSEVDRALVEQAGYADDVAYWRPQPGRFADRDAIRSVIGRWPNVVRIAVDDARVLTAAGSSNLFEAKHPPAAVVSAEPYLAEAMRLKDDDELARLREAANLADIAYTATVDRLHPELRAYEIVRNVDRSLRAAGGGGWWSPGEDGRDVTGMTAFPHGAIVGLLDRQPETGVLDVDVPMPFHLHPLARCYTGASGTTVVFRRPDAELRGRSQRLSSGLYRALESLAPGVRGDEVHRAFAEEFQGVAENGHAAFTGYSVGTGAGEVLVGGDSTSVLEPRMAVCLRASVRGEAGRPGVVFQTTAVITEQGAERLDVVVPLRLIELY